MPFAVHYFNQDVLDEIESWPVGVEAHYARLLELLMEFGPLMRLPHSRAMGAGLFELRPHHKCVEGRVMYCFVGAQGIVMLHSFLKKSRATRDSDLHLARRRAREVHRGK
jgi:phage-related protein